MAHERASETSDPVEEGLIASLARPGGNVTGLAVPLGQLAAKHIELLKDIPPPLFRVAVLWDPAIGLDRRRMGRVEAACQRVGAQVHAVEATTPAEAALLARADEVLE